MLPGRGDEASAGWGGRGAPTRVSAQVARRDSESGVPEAVPRAKEPGAKAGFVVRGLQDSSAEAAGDFEAWIGNSAGWMSMAVSRCLVNLFPSPETVQIAAQKLRRAVPLRTEQAQRRPPVARENGPFAAQLETDAKIPRPPRPPRGSEQDTP